MFEKKALFSAGFKGFLHLLSKPFVSYVGLSFCWFCFSLLSFYFLLLLFDKSSCYVLFFFLIWVSLVWLCVMCCVFGGLFLVWDFFFGGFKGQVRWPKGPPQLALKPPSLFCFVFWFVFVCFVLVGFCLFFGFLLLFYLEGFKGQVRSPFRPPHLTLKPSLVVFVVCFWFVFACVGMNQKTFFSSKRRLFFLHLFSV